MSSSYDNYTLNDLKDLIWGRGIIPKRWMLNYVKKSEAVYLAENIFSAEDLPKSYVKVIKERCSKHRKKVYRSRKNRQLELSSGLTKEEKIKRVLNTADSLIFVEAVDVPEGFTSYLGSSRGKLAFVFKDPEGVQYKFTRTEVEKLAKAGLYVPRGVLSVSRTKMNKPAKASNTLKDIFGT